MPIIARTGREETASAANFVAPGENADNEEAWRRAKTKLKAVVGEDVYLHWFNSTEFEMFDGGVLSVSAPTKFLKNWIQNHYSKALRDSCLTEFSGLERIDIQLRQPGSAAQKAALAAPAPGLDRPSEHESRGGTRPMTGQPQRQQRLPAAMGTNQPGTQSPFDGSPLDPRYTFENFVVGAANRLAHAAAKQVAETVLEQPLRFNPLFIHSSVGLGKTHLLHAIAWDVKRRHPSAHVLYLTAERFRYHFVGAVMSWATMAATDPELARCRNSQRDIMRAHSRSIG